MFVISHHTSLRLAAITCPIVALLSGCGSGSAAKIAPLGPENVQRAMEAYDKDGNGVLSAEELKQSPPLHASLIRMDTDRNGAISVAELTTRMEGIAGGAQYIGITIRITDGGRPVEGAQVVLIPEPFMGEAYPRYSGTSITAGYCAAKSEGAELPGTPAGWYRAEVTKPGATAPVVKGVEIASDTTGNRVEIAL